MSLPKGEDLEKRYRALFANKEIQEVVHARTPNAADPVNEDAILRFVEKTAHRHAQYVRSVFSSTPKLD